MSSGSPNVSRSKIRTLRGCTVVSPQPTTDAGILDSVAGFISDVATTYNNPIDHREPIQWVKFDHLDNNIYLNDANGEKIVPAALILIVGYKNGMQVWAIPANGEAIDILSWRHGTVKVFRFLPSPYKVGCDPDLDLFAQSRPLMALCALSTSNPNLYSLSFLSVKSGEQVKVINFKSPIIDVLANKRSVVVTFPEKLAIFDAFSLKSILAITTCHISPGINANPAALGSRWLAYAEKKFIYKKSKGGSEGEGIQSYKATVLQAAKSISKGLMDLGGTVASSLTGSSTPIQSQIGINPELVDKGIVTILDIDGSISDDNIASNVVAHFTAQSEAIVSLSFDPSGMLLLTADKNGHHFQVFRIHPHPGGSGLTAIHHLYTLYRGDTTAKVQDMCFSPDSRWVAVSTLRGTTHIFPITPYGGNIGNRTHASPHVVNRLSRFHRSAGLTEEARSNSPISVSESSLTPSSLPFVNPRMAPYPLPTLINPLSQIRLSPYFTSSNNLQQRSHSNRPRTNSTPESLQNTALRLCICFAASRAYFDSVNEIPNTFVHKHHSKAAESLFIMSSDGCLLQYDLDPVPSSNVPKDKVCDETSIELNVESKAQWILQRENNVAFDVPLPISAENLKHLPQDILCHDSKPTHTDEQWLSQVEIVTHAGPHRRLWMGPQFSFKTYTQSMRDPQNVEIGRSQPVNMPRGAQHSVLIESGSTSSCEQSPKLLDRFRRHVSHELGGSGESQLREDLADAMLESPMDRETGGRCVVVSMKSHNTRVAKVVNPLGTVVTVHSEDDAEVEVVEEIIIHENCDEALFRPVVAPKTFLFPEHKKRNPIEPTPHPNRKSDLKEKSKIEVPESDNSKKGSKKDVPKVKAESKQNKIVPLERNMQIAEDKSETELTVILPPAKKSKLKKLEMTPPPKPLELDLDILNEKDKEVDVAVPLITTPDLMDNVEICDFHFDNSESKTFDCESLNFTPLTRIEDVIKEEKFEDARDTADSETYTPKEDKNDDKIPKFEHYQGLEPEEIVFFPEEDKSSNKKPRKPKTKLGVRLGKGKDIILEKIEKENDEPADVILPPPKKSWSSILKAEHDVEGDKFLDFQPIKTSDIPIKSYSSAAKHSLLEIDPNEDLNDSGVLLPEKSSSKISKKIDRLLKLSDDEKQETGSSQNETTESDDSATKIIAMDTEEDGCQIESSKNVHTEKNVKRKSKKKKR